MDDADPATLDAGSRKVPISHPDRVLFPDCGVTKRDLAEHLIRAAPRMTAQTADHPLALKCCPDGIRGKSFFLKQVPSEAPGWLPRVEVPRESGGSVEMVTADGADVLAWCAGRAAVELHPLLSRADALDVPDRLVFDLDPPGDGFSAVRDAAAALHGLLDELELPSYPMATGSRGLHIVVPLRPEAGFRRVRDFAAGVADELAARHPRSLTTAFRKADRGGRLFVDILRNQYAQHAVAPYSVRARPGAPVAMPLVWDEVAQLRDARQWGLADPDRLAERLAGDDPWAGMRRHAHALAPAERRLASLASTREHDSP